MIKAKKFFGSDIQGSFKKFSLLIRQAKMVL